jgi:tRNA (guanine37-N1)-methyltransferase
MTPQGRTYTQKVAEELYSHQRIAIICGRYEGVDERVRQYLVTDEISIGDFVLTGGELPALMLIDSITRLIPGALGDPDGAQDDSFASGLLEYPHYTRPAQFRDWRVPDVLLSGNHAEINRWRREQSLARTWRKRPDLLEKFDLTSKDRLFLRNLEQQQTPSSPAAADALTAEPNQPTQTNEETQ